MGAGRATVVLRRGRGCVTPPSLPLILILAQGAVVFKFLIRGGSAKVAVVPAAALLRDHVLGALMRAVVPFQS